jgi:UDP-N-acetylmuramoyl-tripeptide--D-alanyl-D-alanine ligase
VNITELYKIFQQHPAVSTDTRKDVENSLFFALRGETFNGNEFAREAISKGAAFAVVDEGDFADDERFIRVKNSLVTLQELARYHRMQLNARLIAITGSNGKTTTKELVREILSKKYKVCATEGNLNNHIGVPLTLLGMDGSDRFGIIEMGANHIGEIELLCHITRPDYGLITNIGWAHIEGFGSLEGVKKAKGELYKYLSGNNGVVFINAGNATLEEMVNGFKGTLIRYGNAPGALCRGYVKELHPYLSFGITFHPEHGKQYTGTTWLVGSYNLENILAATCIGRYFDIESDIILEAVSEYSPGMMRSQLVVKNKNILVADAYNANPSSMEPAIQDFAADPHPNKVLVLGEMKELGDAEIAEHEKLIRFLAGKPFQQVMLIGPVFSKLDVPEDYMTFHSSGECIEWLKNHPVVNAKVLLKGSRLVKLEELMDYF